ncbi:MAG: hypothetical protein GTO02_00045, partial [Candidatus Dadabacteria bacterium]|nr:hypothetical protein [Candidatus Dadabacteria bacterium]
MNKLIITAVLSLIVGIGIGILLTVFAYPFIFPPPEVNEQINNIEEKKKIKSGAFIHPNPSDPVHWGKGDVSIYVKDENIEVLLEKNFEVGPGPAYHVYLSTGSEIKSNDQFEAAENYDLGKLKSFKSSQVYQVP